MDNKNKEYDEYREKHHDIRAERIKAKKRLKRRRIISGVVVIGIIFAGFSTKNLWMPQVADFFQEKKENIISDGTLEEGEGFPITLSQSSFNYITTVSDMPTVISDTHITMFNSKGGVYKKVQHLFANPVYYTAGENLFVYDLDGVNFAIYDKKGEVYKQKTDGEIVVATCSNNGKVAVVTQTDKASSLLTIYDEKGEAIFKWSGSQRIVSVSFNSDGTGCIVSAFSASGGKIVSRLYGFEFDKTQEVFKTSDLDVLVLKSGYCDNGDMWLLGDTRLYRVGADGSVIYTYEYERDLSSYAIDEKNVVLTFDSVTGKRHEIMIFGQTDTPSTFSTDSEIIKLNVLDSQVTFLTKNSFTFLNDSGKVISSMEVEKEYSDYVINDDTIYFMGYNEVDKVIYHMY